MAFKPFPKDTIFFPEEKKQKKLLVVLAVVVLGALIILYFGFGRPIPPIQPAVGELAPSSLLFLEKIINKIDFDVSFFKSQSFQVLKVYGEWPLEIGEKGRSNPFIAY